MNKEYVEINGNIVVEDENGIKKPVEYRDNLDEILIQENIIETMQMEKQELEEKCEDFRKSEKSNKQYILFLFVIGLIGPILAIAILSRFGIFDLEPFCSIFMNTIFGPMTAGTVFTIGMSTLGALIGGSFSLANYAVYREELKIKNARKASIEYLNGALEKAKEDLEEMKKQKTEESKKKGFRIVKINDSQAILELYEHIQLYYTCGYNGEKYYRYYKKHGQLPKKLTRTYNEDGQQAIKEYLEENGPTLVKKRVS